MATYSEQLQKIWHEFEESHGNALATPREVVLWAVQNGLLHAPKTDPFSLLAEELARALREEYKTDAKGRRYRVNHAVRVTRDGIQMSLWGGIDSPRDHMVRAFAQRRKQIVGDCVQLQVDVDVYNDAHRDTIPIQMVLDFRDDVAEELGLREDAA